MDISDKKQFTAHLNPTSTELLQEFIENYEAGNNTELISMRAVFEALLEVATSRFKPYKENTGKIKELETMVERHQAECQEKIAGLSQENEQLKEQLQNIEKQSNDSIISYSDLHKGLLDLLKVYLKHEKTLISFERANKLGKMDGIIDRIKADDEERKKIKTLLLNTFVLSAAGKKLPYLFSRTTIFETLKEVINNE